MASCPRNDELAAALKTPEVMELRKKLHNLMNTIPCNRPGNHMTGGDVATMAKIGTVAIAIAVAIQSTVDVSNAMSAQCTAFQLTAGLIAGSGYCNAQAALLATTVTTAVAKLAAAGTATYALANTGGKKRTRRRKSGRRKSNKKKSSKKRKKRTRRRR